MMLLELRDSAPKLKTMQAQYTKVSNPANPREFVYVENSVLAHLTSKIEGDGMSGFFGDLWNGVKGAVGGFVTGGVVGAVTGAVGGVIQGKAPKVAVSRQANAGTASLTLTAPTGAVPAVVQAAGPPPAAKDNTPLYIGLAVAGLVLLTK